MVIATSWGMDTTPTGKRIDCAISGTRVTQKEEEVCRKGAISRLELLQSNVSSSGCSLFPIAYSGFRGIQAPLALRNAAGTPHGNRSLAGISKSNKEIA